MNDIGVAEPATLAAIDVFIIGLYIAGVFAVGAFFMRYVRSATDLFVAGKALPFWAVGMSIVVSDIGAVSFISVSGATYTYGIAAANFDWIGSMPAMMVAAFIFIPYYWRAGVYTIPEFLGKRYNNYVQVIHAIIWGIFLITMLAVMLWMTSLMLSTVLGINVYFAIWMMVIIVGIYTLSGGLSAVVLTDVVQMIVMFVGGFAMVALCIWEIGGWGAMQEQILGLGPDYQHHFDLLLPHDADTPYPWTGIVFGLGIVLAIGYMAGNQAVVQRTLGARTEWDCKGGMLFAGFLKCFIPILVALPGLAAIVLIGPDLADGDSAMPMMIRDLLPPGLRGLMFAALFAALMSSVDSYLNSSSTIWTNDLYGRLLHTIKGRPISQRHGLIVGRVFMGVFIVLAGLIAPLLEGQEAIYNFIQTSLSMFQGPVFAILLLGIMWRRTTQWGGLAGLVIGVTFTTILHNTEGVFPSEAPFLFVAMWSFVFSLAVTVIVSLLTPPDPDDKVRGLIFSQVIQDGKVQRVLQERVE